MRISQLSAPLFSMFLATAAYGNDVDVVVVDRDGERVSGVGVYAVRLDDTDKLPNPAVNAVMDQKGMQFVPHLLIVQTGTPIEFPNSDSVAHHVYSFSHPNKFMLPMYKGHQHPPVTFEHPGVVSLGCNIHDHMLGFVLVVDSTEFTKTDENGHASLSLQNSGQYAIRIWSPRIRDKDEYLSKSLTMSAQVSAEVTFSLTKKLNRPHVGRSEDSSWIEYGN